MMRTIQSAFNQWDDGGNLDKKLEQAKSELLKDPIVQKALIKKPELTEETLEQGLIKLFEYQKERHHCEQCPGLEKCPNMMQGYQPELVISRGHLDLTYHACSLKAHEVERRKRNDLIKSLYIPREIFEADFQTIDFDGERADAIAEAIEFAGNVNPGEDPMGLYLYGRFGVGKTYIVGAIANQLMKRGVETFTVYTPDFFTEMKNSIGNGTFQEKLNSVKKAKVLILDDIGAETMSPWVRDEVLGSILQHRMFEKLPTVFTSNYNYEGLEKHLMYSDKSGTEELKALRIMERIRHYTKLITIEGKNRRQT
ncbi:primosomal protein DnaI [Alkalihalobacillus alcalophilus]